MSFFKSIDNLNALNIYVEGSAILSDGTESAPSLRFTSDSRTGIYFIPGPPRGMGITVDEETSVEFTRLHTVHHRTVRVPDGTTTDVGLGFRDDYGLMYESANDEIAVVHNGNKRMRLTDATTIFTNDVQADGIVSSSITTDALIPGTNPLPIAANVEVQGDLDVTGVFAPGSVTTTGNITTSGTLNATDVIASNSIQSNSAAVTTLIGTTLAVSSTATVQTLVTDNVESDSSTLTITGNVDALNNLTVGSTLMFGNATTSGPVLADTVSASSMDATNIVASNAVTAGSVITNFLSATTGTLDITNNVDVDGSVNVATSITAVDVVADTMTVSVSSALAAATADSVDTATLNVTNSSTLDTVVATGVATGTLNASGLSALANVTATDVNTGALDVTGAAIASSLSCGGGVLRQWFVTSADIDALAGSGQGYVTTTGTILEGSVNGHCVFGIRGNGTNDTFSWIHTSDYDSTPDYTSGVLLMALNQQTGLRVLSNMECTGTATLPLVDATTLTTTTINTTTLNGASVVATTAMTTPLLNTDLIRVRLAADEGRIRIYDSSDIINVVGTGPTSSSPGCIIESPVAGQCVIGIRGNNGSNSFSIIHTETWPTDGDYSNGIALLRVTRDLFNVLVDAHFDAGLSADNITLTSNVTADQGTFNLVDSSNLFVGVLQVQTSATLNSTLGVTGASTFGEATFSQVATFSSAIDGTAINLPRTSQSAPVVRDAASSQTGVFFEPSGVGLAVNGSQKLLCRNGDLRVYDKVLIEIAGISRFDLGYTINERFILTGTEIDIRRTSGQALFVRDEQLNGVFRVDSAGVRAVEVLDGTNFVVQNGAVDLFVVDASLQTINSVCDANFTSSTPSSSPVTGALVVAGGVGIGGALHVSGEVVCDDAVSASTLDVVGAFTASSVAALSSNITTTVTTSVTTSSLTTDTANITSFANMATAEIASLIITNSATLVNTTTDTLNVSSTATFTDPTDATLLGTGSVIYSGGISVLKQIQCNSLNTNALTTISITIDGVDLDASGLDFNAPVGTSAAPVQTFIRFDSNNNASIRWFDRQLDGTSILSLRVNNNVNRIDLLDDQTCLFESLRTTFLTRDSTTGKSTDAFRIRHEDDVTGTHTLLRADTFTNSLYLDTVVDAINPLTGSLVVAGGIGVGGTLEGTSARFENGTATYDVGRTLPDRFIIDQGSIDIRTPSTQAILVRVSGVETFRIDNNTPQVRVGATTEFNVDGALIVDPVSQLMDTSCDVNMSSTTPSSSPSTGAFVVDGGMGVGLSAYIGEDLDVTGDATVGGMLKATTGRFQTGPVTYDVGRTFPDRFIIDQGSIDIRTPSTQAILVRVSGVETFRVDNNTPQVRVGATTEFNVDGALIVDPVSQLMDTSCDVNMSSTTPSSSPSTGALVVDGGMGVGLSAYIGEDLDVTGDATVGGVILLSDGTLSAPAFAFTGNASVGFYRNGINIQTGSPIVFRGGGVSSMNAGTALALTTPGGNPGFTMDLDTNNDGSSNIRWEIRGSESSGDLFLRSSTTGNYFAFIAATAAIECTPPLTVLNTTESSAIGNGAFIVDGGASVAKTLRTDALQVASTSTLDGTTSFNARVEYNVLDFNPLSGSQTVTIAPTYTAVRVDDSPASTTTLELPLLSNATYSPLTILIDVSTGQEVILTTQGANNLIGTPTSVDQAVTGSGHYVWELKPFNASTWLIVYHAKV